MSSRGAAIVRFNLLSMRKMFLFCPWRVHNRGADVVGRYAIFVKRVLLILFEGFTSTLLFVAFFPSRNFCLALDWEINAGREIERFGIWIDVLAWQLQ